MTPDQADQTLMLFAAQWPGKISDPTLLVWHQRLLDHDHETIQKAVGRLADTEPWWPCWSKVMEAVRAEQRAGEADRALPEPDGPPATLQEMRAGLAECRATLRNTTGAG